MKRFLTLVSVAVLILGLAATSYAVDFGASGFVRVRSYMGMNAGAFPVFGAAGYDDSEAWMDTRFRLKFSAKANDYATGVIYFEGDSTRWGERETPRYYGDIEDVNDPNSFTSGRAVEL